MHAKHPEIAKRWDKIHNSPSYKKMMGKRGRKKMMTNSGGGFAAAAQRRLDAGKHATPAGSRGVRAMASGRSIAIPSQGVRKAQPLAPGTMPNKQMPAFASAARRKIAAQRNA